MSDVLQIETLGKAFVPKSIRPDLRRYFLKAGYASIPYTLFGSLFYLSALMTGVIYALFIFKFASQQNTIVLLIGTFISWAIIQIILAATMVSTIYFYMDLKIYDRTRQMEEVLPDFLQIVSSNLKGGMSFEKSLWSAINPKFKVLSEEIGIAAKKVMTGEDIEVALAEFIEKYNSPMLKRSIELIISEVEGGGKISDIIDRVIYNLKQTKDLKEEMSASVLTYVIFITTIVILISPGLFALSYNLLIMIGSFMSKLALGNLSSAGINMPLSFSGVSIDPNMFKKFSYAALATIAIFSSMIVSIIQKGNVKGGVRFIPVFVASSLFFYWLFMYILSIAFSGFSI